MILVTILHEDFGNFDIALEPTETENVYQAKCYNPQYQAEKELDIAARRKRPWPAAIGLPDRLGPCGNAMGHSANQGVEETFTFSANEPSLPVNDLATFTSHVQTIEPDPFGRACHHR